MALLSLARPIIIILRREMSFSCWIVNVVNNRFIPRWSKADISWICNICHEASCWKNGLHQAYEGVQAKTLGGEAGDGKGLIGTMYPSISSNALTETRIELPLARDIAWSACSCRSAGNVLSKLAMDQPDGATGAVDEKNSTEWDTGRGGKEAMMMDLSDLTVESSNANICGV